MTQTLNNWVRRIQAMHPKQIEMGLERVRCVAKRLSLLDFDCPVIKVAGTNGKGSVVAGLEALALTAGQSVAIYTSPHFFSITERLRVNGRELSADDWCQAFEAIELARGAIPLTFFEFSTLAVLSMIAARQAKLDLIVLEVGLGGRLDAVNVVNAVISVISNIALDHQAYLGDNREAIAQEKAGVIAQHGVLICGDAHPPQSLIQAVHDRQAKAYFIGQDFQVNLSEDQQSWAWRARGAEYHFSVNALKSENLGVALQTWHCLQRCPIDAAGCQRAFSAIKLPCRYEIDPKLGIIFDVAHNPDAVAYLCQRLKQQGIKGRWVAVCAMFADKDMAACLALADPLVDQWILPTLTVEPTGAWRLPSAEQRRAVAPVGAQQTETVAAAMQMAMDRQDKDDWIVVFGSFQTVLEAKQFLDQSIDDRMSAIQSMDKTAKEEL